MLRDLRLKLRNRHSRISSCTFEDFLPLTKQFFSFVDSNSVLKAVITELLARNPDSVSGAQTADPNGRVYGETAEENATICYVKWQAFAAQNNPHAFWMNAGGELQEALAGC